MKSRAKHQNHPRSPSCCAAAPVWRWAFVLTVCCVLGAAEPARAQGYSADKPLGASAQSTPEYLRKAGIDQNLNKQLPLHDMFVDESGSPVMLDRYFGSRPVVLALVYNKCGMLCPQVLHGMGSALRQSGMHAGQEYEVIVASIDPTDTAADTAEPKKHLEQMLGADPGSLAAAHVHFLTAQERSIDDLAAATGFHYVRVPGPDGKMNQFAHSSVIMIATPGGRMSKYLSGIEYQPRDLRLALIEASNHRIGSLADLVLLFCCNYTPTQGRYTVAIMRVLGLAAMGSLAMLGMVLYLLTRKR